MTLEFLRIVAVLDAAWTIFWIWRMTKAVSERHQDTIVVWFIIPGIIVFIAVGTSGFYVQ